MYAVRKNFSGEWRSSEPVSINKCIADNDEVEENGNEEENGEEEESNIFLQYDDDYAYEYYNLHDTTTRSFRIDIPSAFLLVLSLHFMVAYLTCHNRYYDFPRTSYTQYR